MPRRRQVFRAPSPLSQGAPFLGVPTTSTPGDNKRSAGASSSAASQALAAAAFSLGGQCSHSHRFRCCCAVFAAAPIRRNLAQSAMTAWFFPTKTVPLAQPANAVNSPGNRCQTGTTRSQSEARKLGTKTGRQSLKPNSWASPFDALNRRPFSGPRSMTNRLAAWPAALLTGLHRTKVNTLPKIRTGHLYVH